MENPTHDVIPPPTFDKAWQRRNYHAPEKAATEAKYYDAKELEEIYKRRRERERELAKMIRNIRMNAKRTTSTLITYAEAAKILGVSVRTVADLVRINTIAGRKKMVSLSSVEVYRDTRRP